MSFGNRSVRLIPQKERTQSSLIGGLGIKARIAVVIPAYQSEESILDVIRSIPTEVELIVVVDDCSMDRTVEVVRGSGDPRVRMVQHPVNQGVGGAMISGYRSVVEMGADVVVKIDSDGQMDPEYIWKLVGPLVKGEADYTKGNRFLMLRGLQSMPFLRRVGNVALSFLTKLASGYWNVFDPTNGYTAIRAETIRDLDFDCVHKRFFFESSMLLELGLLRAVVRDVSIPAKYGSERSSLSEVDSLFRFPPLLIRGFFKRLVIQYFVRDFSAVTMFLLLGLPLVLFGFVFGLVHWVESISTGIPATTGTVMVAVLPFILGVQFLLQAAVMDIQNVPGR